MKTKRNIQRKELHSTSRQEGTRKTIIAYFLLGVLAVLLIVQYVQHRTAPLPQTGKATGLNQPPSAGEQQRCIDYWDAYCHATECAGTTVQCTAYCNQRTDARCRTGNMPVPSQ